MKSLVVHLSLICGGGLIGVVLCELLMQMAGAWFVTPLETLEGLSGRPRIMFTEIWTQGADAAPGEGFVDLIKRDPEFQQFSIINRGYGGNNVFESINNMVDATHPPDIVFFFAGSNTLHAAGLNRFTEFARNYFTEDEFSAFSADVNPRATSHFWQHLKLYRFARYVARAFKWTQEETMTLKELDKKFGTPHYFEQLKVFRQAFPKGGQALNRGLAKLLREDSK